MSRILVIEPQRMLRHALLAALAPEHDVKSIARLDNKIAAAEFDALVVDLAALQETGALTEETLEALRSASLPMVLIDGVEGVPMAERAGLARLQAPIGRDGLKTALRQCFSSETGAAVEAPETERPKRGARPVPTKKQKAEAPLAPLVEDQPAGVIELTEIVEED
ncbi:MAG: hypothetical protein FJ145_18235 [Deltaproteobacteria bacterium]|nr:hypothetical protein [Deltaproteobacteria bacterium]